MHNCPASSPQRMQGNQTIELNQPMIALLITPLFAAAGYSLIYLLGGGGLFGAVVIFVVAKMLGK
jgi:uncharacterized membrane-anchored protein YitT (DUF2179 family)